MRRSAILLCLVFLLSAGCSRAPSHTPAAEPVPAQDSTAAQTQTVSETLRMTNAQTPETDAVSETAASSAPPETTAAPPVTTTAPPAATTAPPDTTTAAPAPQNGELAFETEYFTVHSCREDPRGVQSHILLSPADVAAYFEENDSKYMFSALRSMNPDVPRDFDELAAKFDDAFFRTHQIILLEVPENSGSVRNTVKSVRRSETGGIEVAVDRYVPQVQTCDMAYTHLFIELLTQQLQPSDRVLIQRTDVQSPQP